jgi:uncharacterized protein YdaU (DUF1376 family)
MRKLPWFPLYTADFLVSTSSFTNEEVGAFIRLLSHEWDKGVLPADMSRLARLAGYADAHAFALLWDVLKDKFTAVKDGFVNERMEQQRVHQEEVSRKRSSSSLKRWDSEKLADANAYPNALQMDMQNATESESEAESEATADNSSAAAVSSSPSNPEQDVLEEVYAKLGEKPGKSLAKLLTLLRNEQDRASVSEMLSHPLLVAKLKLKNHPVSALVDSVVKGYAQEWIDDAEKAEARKAVSAPPAPASPPAASGEAYNEWDLSGLGD